MPRPGLLPIAAAVALTAAAGLSIAAERGRTLASARAPLALPALPGDAGAAGQGADATTVPRANSRAVPNPAPAVGSRALTGHDEKQGPESVPKPQ